MTNKLGKAAIILLRIVNVFLAFATVITSCFLKLPGMVPFVMVLVSAGISYASCRILKYLELYSPAFTLFDSFMFALMY